MSLETDVMTRLKEAMKTKDEGALRALRAIKAEIIKAKTEPGANGAIDEAAEMKLLQRLFKQRMESIETFEQNNRQDLADKEKEELRIIEKFLPARMSESELKEALTRIIAETGAASPADMGKVMGAATKQLAGKADGKAISAIVKTLLA
ncbi:GatB/YqeY domain-containing protein [Haoranjiania flava]|uniref:GatB/YqeY domain-containing protein n=1 Tax=Haoranjiania flava TaxID=1856322 RepID=A0AAE3IP93_9BACT|nr:GatB/YqeY domain-containing protein [Haoranjiania flava]MCU7693991.1 GatB/YqeY domain-containing protein [Haoranjiania flava]